MFTLSDITIYTYIHHLKESGKTNPKHRALAEFLVKHKIFNLSSIKDYIYKGHPLLCTEEFYKMVSKGEELLSKINYHSKSVFRYQFKPQNRDYMKAIIYTNSNTTVSDILISNPLRPNPIPDDTNKLPVNVAKYLLSKINIQGINALEVYRPNLTPEQIELIANSMYAYEAQIARVCKITRPDYNGHLYFKDEAAKRKIVKRGISDIASYLISNGATYLWGTLTEEEQRKLLNEPSENLIRLIANNVTIREASEGLVKNRTLNRFIVK